MPSFLSKVFGRKKGDEKEAGTPRSVKRSSDPSLLEGRFEAVPSTVSPSTPKFPEDPHALEKGKDRGGDKAGPFGLLRSKSRPQPSSPITDAPHLTLRLPGTIDKNNDSLAASFNPQADETDDSILTRRLTPAETLSLIDACSKAITERGGLETLGVMRPHWHSASPQLQRKLISLFIHSLAQKSSETTLAPSTSASAAFNSELEYTRSVHDIAAVFRWALRHLKVEGASFGSSSSSDEWSWYHNFCESERKSAYDPRVFTAGLVPEIPPTHATLLIPTLDIISSLAAHAEANGYSGSKLSKYFGFWLLTARRAAGTEDWSSFYTRWEVSGRMLEHLFLSWLRDENTKRPLPRRLQELVAQYPYTTSSDPTVDGLLTRPRFSTRRHDALFVRVEAVYADNVQTHPPRSPVGIFADALKSKSKSDGGEHIYLWDQVKAAAAAATVDSDDRPLLAILSDDTLNLLSLVSTDPKDQVLLGIPGAASNLVTPLSPITESFLPATANGNGVPAPLRKPTIPTSTPQSPKDWAEFSSAGFGEVTLSKNFASTLLDKDVEVTEPPVERKPSKRKQGKSTTTSTRTSAEFSSPVLKPAAAPEEPEAPKLTLVATEIVQLDEAFVDFWQDAVVDPVSSDWPTFVVVELKHPLTSRSISSSEEVSTGSPINWIIIEEKFRRPTPPPTPVIPPETSTTGGLKVSATPLKRTSSPRPSFGEKKGSLSATFKRFTLFGGSKDDLADDGSPEMPGSSKRDISGGGRKKPGASKSPRIGEMGEVLSEEPEPLPEVPKRVDEPKKVEKKEVGKSEVVAAAAGVVGGAVLATVGAVKDARKDEAKEEVEKADSTTKDDKLPVPPQDDSPAEGVEEPETQKPLPEVPPVVEERLVVSEVVTPEPIVDEPPPTTFPTETATTEPAADETTPRESNAPVPEVPTPEEVLPPAPESVVSHGETPGPQLALDSTEAGLHHVPEPVTQLEEPQDSATELIDIPPVHDTEETGTQSPEPTIEHLEDKVEDPAADAGVDLDPVPIVTSDPVEAVEIEKPEPVGVEPEVAEISDVTTTTPEPQPESPAATDEEPTSQEDVPAAETPAPVLEQESEPAPIQPTVEAEGAVPTSPPEEPQSDASPLVPS